MGDENLVELRIHGVNNTPPVNLLYAIQEEYGDSLIGVYRQRDHDHTVKAFSWGGLARTSPIPRIPFGGLARTVTSAAWVVVIPFGLANVAYWSRRLTLPRDEFITVRNTAALSRLFSLGLTLLFVASLCSVSLDMADARVAGEPEPTPPKWLAWLAGVDPGDRMAILSLVPVAALLFLWGLAMVTRSRYDRGATLPVATTAEGSATAKPAAAEPDKWKFGSTTFWDNADLSKHNARVHTAAGVSLTLVWTGQFWLTGHRGWGYAVIAAGLLVIAGCVLIIRRMPLVTEGNAVDVGRKRFANLLMWVSFAIFMVQFIALFLTAPPAVDAPRLAGLSFVPGALVFVLLVLAVSALGWRWREAHSYCVAAIPIALGLASLAAHQWWKPTNRADLTWLDVLLIAFLVVAAGMWLVVIYRPGTDTAEQTVQRTAQAWRGTAPGVLMVLALFAAVLLSTVFVMVGAALIGDGRLKVTPTEQMTAPPFYLSFAAMIPVFLMLLVLFVGYVVVGVLRCATPVEPLLDETAGPSPKEMIGLTKAFDEAQPKKCRSNRPNLPGKRCLTRRLVSIAHRAEPLVAVLAGSASAALIGGLALCLMLHDEVVRADNPVLQGALYVGVAAAVLLGGAIIGVGASRSRPLGIVWDLICFLPRAAHPFGPPCYAQRAVPELRAYCQAWLDSPTDADDPIEARRLLLSAHSLGGVLAVAVILLLADRYPGRVGLVTYGCQLRAYFGRIFPELLGPRILGVTNSRPARLRGCPTFPTAGDDHAVVPTVADDPDSVLTTLTEGAVPRWINLWRPTDYLGFPVYSRQPPRGTDGQPDNPVDRAADDVTQEVSPEGRIDCSKSLPGTLTFAETSTVRVDTHSDYFRAPQYATAVDDLRKRLRASS